ncbi:MAG: nucleotidyltransferase domain-containing protein [Nitrososphaeria archaeon]
MQRKSSNSAEIRLFRLDLERVLEFLKAYARRLVDTGRAELVVLVGSLARGDYTAFSDADLLIVAEDVPKLSLDRISAYMDSKSPIDIEPRVLTKNEFYIMASEKSRLVREVLEYGIVLAGDSKILDNAKVYFSSK